MRNTRIVLMSLLGIYLLSGCATIWCGDSKNVTVLSEPSGADYTIKNKGNQTVAIGTTPDIVNLRRGDGYFGKPDYIIELNKEGYETKKFGLSQPMEWEWYFAGNFLVGGIIGWAIVDPMTGGMWDIEDVEVSLTPISIE